MKSYIVRRTQKSVSLKRDKSLQSEDGLKASSIASVDERSSSLSQVRSLRDTRGKIYAKSTRVTPVPYQSLVKQLKIRLPTPKQKFYQFLRIPPFNRIQNQNEMISLFIKNIHFFKIHQPEIITNMARKIKLVELYQLDDKMMIIVLEGSIKYKGQVVAAGQLLNRQQLKVNQIEEYDSYNTKLVALNRHQYLAYLFSYVNKEIIKFRDFINSIQTFKMFTEKTIEKFTQNMTLNYYLKGEKLYQIGDEATTLFVVFSGQVSRKVIIQIQKVNKIPPYAKKTREGSLVYENYKRDVRILTKEYEHKIQFKREDMVGVTQIIDSVAVRKQQINVDSDAILLGIDRSIIEQNLDDYILDNLKKYNLKKYPSSYDQLCENYQKQKISSRKMEQRKILAMKNELKIHYNDRRRQKIEFIIKMYEDNIKINEKVNLKKERLEFQVDKNK